MSSGDNNATATLWPDGALLSCHGNKNDKTSCCHDAWHLLQKLCANEKSKNEMEWWCTMAETIDFEFQCKKTMATVALPPAAGSDDGNGNCNGDYWHALFLSSNGKQQQQEQEEACVKEWKQWIHGGWNDGDMDSPFVVSVPASTSPVSFSANLQSSLSSDGGMHRLLHHSISFACQPEMTTYQASFYMLVFVTEHFFVDVDDAFLSSQEHVIPFLLDSRERIDIEQPAFVSPQHVIIVKVDASGICKNDSQQEEEYVAFATKLHVRYPPLTETGHVQVSFPAPLLYSGWLTDTTRVHQENYTLLTTASDFSWQSPISVQVATGFQDDAHFVGIVTILASLIGSLVLLQKISKVSVWN